MDYQLLRENYEKEAVRFAQAWEVEVSKHNVDIMISIMMHRDGIMTGGGFVEAVCNNDLVGAVSRADIDNLRVIKLLALTNIHCYVA
jgi:hypothetical protein